MKRALAISLAIPILMVMALFAPITAAATSIETSLMFVLQSNGDTYEGLIVSSSDNTINQSNCKDTDQYKTNFRQKMVTISVFLPKSTAKTKTVNPG